MFEEKYTSIWENVVILAKEGKEDTKKSFQVQKLCCLTKKKIHQKKFPKQPHLTGRFDSSVRTGTRSSRRGRLNTVRCLHPRCRGDQREPGKEQAREGSLENLQTSKLVVLILRVHINLNSRPQYTYVINPYNCKSSGCHKSEAIFINNHLIT